VGQVPADEVDEAHVVAAVALHPLALDPDRGLGRSHAGQDPSLGVDLVREDGGMLRKESGGKDAANMRMMNVTKAVKVMKRVTSTWTKTVTTTTRKATATTLRRMRMKGEASRMIAQIANRRDTSSIIVLTELYLRSQNTVTYAPRRQGSVSVELAGSATMKSIGGRSVPIVWRDSIKCPKKNTITFNTRLNRLSC